MEEDNNNNNNGGGPLAYRPEANNPWGAEARWVDERLEDLINLYRELKERCEVFSPDLLRRCSFTQFCEFCYRMR